MTLRLTILLTIAVIFTFSAATEGEEQNDGVELLSKATPPKYNDVIEELKDILVVSMQNVVSNNDLVTQLTQKVVQNMLSVGENKQEMENLKKSHMEEVSKLKEEIESLKKELSSEIGNMEADLKSQIENMETGLNTTVGEIGEIKRDLSLIKEPVTIVSAEEGLREQGCAKVCAGTTGKKTTNWENFSSTGLHVTVDISQCGFITIPTITTALEGYWMHWKNLGGSEVFKATTTSFQTYIYVSSSDLRQRAAELLWNMEWIAVGYTC